MFVAEPSRSRSQRVIVSRVGRVGRVGRVESGRSFRSREPNRGRATDVVWQNRAGLPARFAPPNSKCSKRDTLSLTTPDTMVALSAETAGKSTPIPLFLYS